MKYFDELKRTMEWLARDPKVIFVGQTAAVPGTFMYQTLRDLPAGKALEMPVNESFQMQFTLGLALAGYVPVSIYPRQNFLLLAAGDMANMIDKFKDMSDGQVSPRIVIRTATGPDKPVHPGHQHVGNYAETFRQMFSYIDVIELNKPEDIFPAYERALTREDGKPMLLIEHGNLYNDA
jgi:pyruvate/2-oxoglutarate/acetoin dehydrogenase E1 component